MFNIISMTLMDANQMKVKITDEMGNDEEEEISIEKIKIKDLLN